MLMRNGLMCGCANVCGCEGMLGRRGRADVRGRCAQGGDAVSVRGWPLTLGSRAAVALHLGELDPTLLRSRDCYLCVRPALQAEAEAEARAAPDADGVEVALVWRGAEGPPASRPLPAPRDLREAPLTEEAAQQPMPAPSPSPTSTPSPSPELDSVLAMEEAALLPPPDGAAAGEQALPALLHTLLVSVERALERVPLDELAFPCPQCREACACACGAPPPAPVQKRDSSIQTSPMFEFAGPIPHIDSDDEDDSDVPAAQAGAKATQTPSRAPPASKCPAPHAAAAAANTAAAAAATPTCRTESKACGADDPPDQLPEAPPPRELVAPRYISELSERLLFAGVQLPGTRDLRGRPIVLALAAELAAAAPEAHSLAALLLYYCSLLGSTEEEELEAEALEAVTSRKEVMLLVVSDSQETAALDILDRALALVQGRVSVGSVVVWRAQSQRGGGAASAGALPASQLRWAAATGAHALRALVAEEQAPAACGGRAQHDHREWVDFHKELEPLWALSLACGRRLAGAMGALRAAEGPPPPGRRRLHAQQRALSRALADAELQRLRREGPATLQRLRERALCLPHSAAVRRSTERARRLWEEVDRAARRLEQLCEGRRERLRDLARVRALEEEAAQVLSWLCKKGEETLRRHTNLATNLSAIKEQEQDFEKFYFISMVSVWFHFSDLTDL
ncbi:hypothetical protein R5R35_008807 [Gryllus longicercus]|uniref:Uncharacterized protein n=1 Tax=Gryllus longicercus TaxID=2509291 RepID=A0AAN9VB58_9ORTH